MAVVSPSTRIFCDNQRQAFAADFSRRTFCWRETLFRISDPSTRNDNEAGVPEWTPAGECILRRRRCQSQNCKFYSEQDPDPGSTLTSVLQRTKIFKGAIKITVVMFGSNRMELTEGAGYEYMTAYGLFYSCTVKGYNTGLQQCWDWRGFKGANLPPDKTNSKTEPGFSL